MPINAKYQAVFQNGYYYHVFNRSVKGVNLFFNDGNYVFFLQKFSEYLSGVLDVYAWCLIPNHFHFLVRVKEYRDCSFMEKEKVELQDGSSDVHGVLIKRFKISFFPTVIRIKGNRILKRMFLPSTLNVQR